MPTTELSSGQYRNPDGTTATVSFAITWQQNNRRITSIQIAHSALRRIFRAVLWSPIIPANADGEGSPAGQYAITIVPGDTRNPYVKNIPGSFAIRWLDVAGEGGALEGQIVDANGAVVPYDFTGE